MTVRDYESQYLELPVIMKIIPFTREQIMLNKTLFLYFSDWFHLFICNL